MSYIDETFKRADLQDIREFILHGVAGTKLHSNSYEERLQEATASMYVRLDNTFISKEERLDSINDFNHALTVYSEIYTEIGMKIGAHLLFDLLKSDNTF